MNVTRPTIFLELTQAEAQSVLDLIKAHDSWPNHRDQIATVESKIHEAWSDEDIRMALVEDAIIRDDWDPEADA